MLASLTKYNETMMNEAHSEVEIAVASPHPKMSAFKVTDFLDLVFTKCSDTCAQHLAELLATVMTTFLGDDNNEPSGRASSIRSKHRILCLVAPSKLLGTIIPLVCETTTTESTGDDFLFSSSSNEEGRNSATSSSQSGIVPPEVMTTTVLIPYETVRWLSVVVVGEADTTNRTETDPGNGGAALAARVLIASAFLFALARRIGNFTKNRQQLYTSCFTHVLLSFSQNEQPVSMGDSTVVCQLSRQLLKLPVAVAQHQFPPPSSFSSLVNHHSSVWNALFTVLFSTEIASLSSGKPQGMNSSLFRACSLPFLLNIATGYCPTFDISVTSVKTNKFLSRLELTLTHNLRHSEEATTVLSSSTPRFQIPILVVVVDALATEHSIDDNNAGITVCLASVSWSMCRDSEQQNDRYQLNDEHVSSYTQSVGVFHGMPTAAHKATTSSTRAQANTVSSPLQCVLLPHPRWAWAATSGLVTLSSSAVADKHGIMKANGGGRPTTSKMLKVAYQKVHTQFKSLGRDSCLPSHVAAACDDHQWSGMMAFLSEKCF
ncbi:Hypothetical protein, putative [Bodo saltans]|uniref:Uncharacterized protein n=1 Tax=Bodo saltans TaxID=75058 RepID=A0A0S4JRM3_BODSA|nr:Hypothetical protein, putative [Bodo saltans]|eukprot:CUG94172.1 Hypothetical protein, putative [Bodo saltans]